MTREPPKATKFVADAMLGSTARKLRAFGFDTAYFKDGDDPALVALAKKDGRIILTADRTLAARGKTMKVPIVLLDAKTEGGRLESIGNWAHASGNELRRGSPRCSSCNGTLRAITPKDAEGKVPRSVAERHRLFYECRPCGKYYWRGSHWKKLRSMSRRLELTSHDDP